MPQSQPVVVGVGFFGVRQVAPATVADEEQIAQHLDRLALLPLTEERRHRQPEVLAEQVEQRRLDGGRRMDRRPQVEGLLAPATAVAVGERVLQRPHQAANVADRLADDEPGRVVERRADLLAAGHLADAGAARVVGDDQQVAGEERAVRAAQVEQHAVTAGDRNRPQRPHPRRRRGSHRCRLHRPVWSRPGEAAGATNLTVVALPTQRRMVALPGARRKVEVTAGLPALAVLSRSTIEKPMSTIG